MGEQLMGEQHMAETALTDISIVDVTDAETFGLIPPCADPAFDHRTCDYWEDVQTGSKAARPSWLRPAGTGPVGRGLGGPRAGLTFNPFLEEASRREPASNPFASTEKNPFAEENPFAPPADNPFIPPGRASRGPQAGVPRKLALLQRGLGVAGSYAKVLLVGGVPAAYAQFGPLSAYPRALALRDLYPQLPSSPPPAVITCVATTAESRRMGYAQRLVEAVCADLAERGFAAVEVYPERGARPDATSAAWPAFWESVGFAVAVDDARFPALRREL
jgi:GNAT superfamily N-acetyltransferase